MRGLGPAVHWPRLEEVNRQHAEAGDRQRARLPFPTPAVEARPGGQYDRALTFAVLVCMHVPSPIGRNPGGLGPFDGASRRQVYFLQRAAEGRARDPGER